MKFKLSEIDPNPFRHIDRYPIRADKVAALRESYRTTGFWGNVVARKASGKVQIAYGHHRLTAARDEFGPKGEIELIVRSLSDEQMLQIMARENMEEWGTSAMIEQETVRAVVEAYAEGKIELEAPGPKATSRELRYAPSFTPGDVPRPGDAHPYTVQAVARFLGWLKPSGQPQEKVSDALAALQFIEEGILSEKDFDGLTTKQSGAVIEQARKARAADETAARQRQEAADRAAREAERAEQARVEAEERERAAKEASDREEARRAVEDRRRAEEERKAAEKRQAASTKEAAVHRERGRTRATTAGRAVSSGIRRGEGYKRASEMAREALPKEEQAPPNIDLFTQRLSAEINRVLDPDRDQRVEGLKQLVKFRQEIDSRQRENLARNLDQLAERAQDYAQKLRSVTPIKQVQPDHPRLAGRR